MNNPDTGDLRFGPEVLRTAMERLESPDAVFTLHVSDGPNERVAYFSGGGVRIISTGERSGPGIESALLDRGLVDIDTLHRTLESARKRQCSTVDALAESKILAREEYLEVVRSLLRDELLDLVFWSDAYFTAYTHTPPAEIYNRESRALFASIDTRALAEDVSEWCEQWTRLRPTLRSDRSVLHITRAGFRRLDKLDPDEKAVLKQCLDATDLRAVWRTTRIDLPELCERLVALCGRGLLTIEPPASPSSDSDLDGRIRQLEEALPHVIGKDLVREKLVALYQQAGRTEQAVAELRAMARSALEHAHQWPLAAERYKKILALDPENVDALEDLVKLYLQNGRKADAVRVVNMQALELVERRSLKEARAAAKMLRSIGGSTRGVGDVLSTFLARTDDQQSAVEQYLSLAREYQRTDDRDAAIRMVRLALEVAPESDAARRLLESLDPASAAADRQCGADGGGARKRRLVRPRRSLAALLLIALGLGAAHWSGLLPCTPLVDALVSRRDANAAPAAQGRPEKLAPGRGANGGERVTGTTEVGGVRIPTSGRPGIRPQEVARHVREVTGGRRSPGGPPSGPARTLDRPPPADPAPPTLVAPRPPADRPPAGEGGERAPSPTTLSPPSPPSTEWSGTPRAPGAGALEESDRRRDWRLSLREIPVAVKAQLRGSAQGGERIVHRVVDERMLLSYGRSAALAVWDLGTQTRTFVLPGKRGHRWAVGYHGESIIRWCPGHRLLVHSPHNRVTRATLWALPEGVEALAAGKDLVATRCREVTSIYRHDGSLLGRRELPRWDHGVFVESDLVLTRDRGGDQGPGGTWVVHPGTLQIIWSCVRDGDGLVVR